LLIFLIFVQPFGLTALVKQQTVKCGMQNVKVGLALWVWWLKLREGVLLIACFVWLPPVPAWGKQSDNQ